IFPTDTVYGFLADATNKKAVEKIYKIKKRPKSKPLAVFVKDLKMAKEMAEIDVRQEKILKAKWPGKFTFIFQRKFPEVGPPEKLYGLDKKTIALRIPKYKFLNDLLNKINKPLAQTSVNISGQPLLTKISDIIKIIGRSDLPIIIVDAGDLKNDKPSTIIDLTADTLTRLR
ncbi:MAG: L-threonylcarbamoyladenylate synthase, partial [Phycisphaerae bacterium]|nr:L-threonylcarbamoyladenylate synthase [Phycisphaerae bacterium]